MDEQERYALEKAQEQMRAALKLLPDKKDDRLTLIREFIGADEEGPAFDVMLVVGDVQKAPPEFWDVATQAGRHLGATSDSPWLSEAGQGIWARQCEG